MTSYVSLECNICSTKLYFGKEIQSSNDLQILYGFGTLQEHQRIRTNATISKDSDFSVLMVVYEIFFFYIFQANLRNQ